MKPQIKRKRFTLIEMIAVVAIAGMLVALFAPAFNRMMFGSKVDQAASNFKLGMEMAQAKAIAERKYVAMFIPCYLKAMDNRLQQYALGGYRLAYVSKSGEEYTFDSWVPGSSWRNADDGARLVRMEAVQNEKKPWLRLYQKNSSENNDSLEDKDLLPTLITETGYDGGMMFELDNSNNEDEDLKSLDQKNWTALVFSPYGGVLNDSRPMLFFFTESKTNADNANIVECVNPDNTSVLMLNGITGRVEYITEDSNE